MYIQHNYLRMHRKRARLAQSDIAHVAALSDHSNVSRWENGTREPNIESLIVYHLLFDVPIESMFERQKQELKLSVYRRVLGRLETLRKMPQDRKLGFRIRFLETALARLANPEPQAL